MKKASTLTGKWAVDEIDSSILNLTLKTKGSNLNARQLRAVVSRHLKGKIYPEYLLTAESPENGAVGRCKIIITFKILPTELITGMTWVKANESLFDRLIRELEDTFNLSKNDAVGGYTEKATHELLIEREPVIAAAPEEDELYNDTDDDLDDEEAVEDEELENMFY